MPANRRRVGEDPDPEDDDDSGGQLRAHAELVPQVDDECGDEHVGEDYEDDDLRDAVIIGSAQRVEHYEMAAYGTAIAHARLLQQDDIVQLLEETLEEEKAADAKLSDIAESVVNLEAADQSEDGEESEEESGAARGRQATSRQRSTAAASTRSSRGTAPARAQSARRRR